jgi:hypothetical protein
MTAGVNFTCSKITWILCWVSHSSDACFQTHTVVTDQKYGVVSGENIITYCGISPCILLNKLCTETNYVIHMNGEYTLIVYNLPPTCFSPSWAGVKQYQLQGQLPTCHYVACHRNSYTLTTIQYCGKDAGIKGTLTHCGPVTQICAYTLQLCKTDDTNLHF